jgi:hypothetical protein
MKFVGQELDNMILNSLNLKITILMFIAYSYISFFEKWNWYVVYVINTNNMNLF